jgi:hydroxymethylglutaryl-CoA reductase
VEGAKLVGRLEVPLAVGTVGATVEGSARARLALRLTRARSAQELAEIMAAVGLAQNFGALRALATEGIPLAEALVAAGDVKVARARDLLEGMRRTGSPRSL